MNTIIRIDPLEKSSVLADDTSTFTIPRGVYDLSTLKLWFLATINGATVNQMSMPRDVETMIEVLQVFIDDREVQHIQHYNQIFRTIEDYNKDLTEHDHRCLLSNSYYINSSANGPISNIKNSTFCMTKWLGLLGCKEIIDTNKIGQIRIVIKWAPNNVLVAAANSTYNLDDVHMTLHRMDDTSTAVSEIEYDDYKPLLQSNATYAQSTQMNVVSRKLDYVMAFFLPSDYKTRSSNITTNFLGTSFYFTHGIRSPTQSFPSITWNFSINGKNLISYNPSSFQYIEFMKDIFPEGAYYYGSPSTRIGSFAATTLEAFMRQSWTTGVKIDIDASDGVNLEFKTFGLSSDPNFDNNFSMIVAKTSRLLTIDSVGGYSLEN